MASGGIFGAIFGTLSFLPLILHNLLFQLINHRSRITGTEWFPSQIWCYEDGHEEKFTPVEKISFIAISILWFGGLLATIVLMAIGIIK